jgi:hypothetical protein
LQPPRSPSLSPLEPSTRTENATCVVPKSIIGGAHRYATLTECDTCKAHMSLICPYTRERIIPVTDSHEAVIPEQGGIDATRRG